MNRNILSGMALFLAFGAMTLGYLPGAQAQIEEATVQVDGLACPFCVKGVEKHLKKIDGVEGVSTNLKKGEVRLRYKPEASFDLAGIQKAVTRGGFTPRAVKVTATGTVTGAGANLLFKVGNGKNSFLILDTRKKETRTKLEEAVESHRTIQVTGQVHKAKGNTQGLSVEAVKEIPVAGGKQSE